MRSRDIVLTIVLTTIGGAIVLGFVGWLGGRLFPTFSARDLIADGTFGGGYQLANLMAVYAAPWGVMFGFITGVLIVVVRSFGRSPE